jgi:SAM-dependent methyltransferase
VTSTSERRTLASSQRPTDVVQDLFHLFPYEFVAESAPSDARILEVGFGEGYGGEILARGGREYIGVDVSQPVVDHAALEHRRENVTFRLYDGMHLPFGDASFDIVVSFHVVEHVVDPDVFVSEAGRVVRRGGRIVLVTPNGSFRLGEDERPWSRFHLREYRPGELGQLLARHFSSFQVLGLTGSKEMVDLERARVSRARRAAKLDPLGLRYRLPEPLLLPVRRSIMRALESRQHAEPAVDLSLADVRTTGEELDDAPHLIALIQA